MKDIEIVWENEEALVINKPAGMVVNRAESVKGETIQDWAEKQDWWKKENSDEVFNNRSGIAHRLDKETSGCLLIAKNSQTLKELMSQFKKREIEKEYITLVHGWIEPEEGRVKLPLARSRVDRKKQKVRYDGKVADTIWKRTETFEGLNKEGWQGKEPWGSKLSLVRIQLMTGRMHQIRVHMSHLGYPIFADEKYLNREQWKKDSLVLRRQFLHAEKIGFKVGGEKFEVIAPLNKELKECVDLLKKEL